MKHDLHRDIVSNRISLYKNNIYNLVSNNVSNIISSIPPEGIILSQSGIYQLNDDINWEANDNSIAITIIASDIILNLNHNSIRKNNNAVNTLGILVALGNNISINNGYIYNIGGSGIISIMNNNISISNIHICELTNNDMKLPSFGILLSNCREIKIHKVYINSISVSSSAFSAISLLDCYWYNIINAEITKLENKSGVCAGISIISSSNGYLSDVKILGINTGSLPNSDAPGHTSIGIVPTESNNLAIINCHGEQIMSNCDDAHFISLYWVTDCRVECCSANYIIDGLSGKGAKATGFEVYANNGVEHANINISNCVAKNIKAFNPGDKQAAGFSVAGSGITFKKCTSIDVKVLTGCNSYGVGFGWAPDIRKVNIYPAKNVRYIKCVAKDCQIGFDSFNHIKCKWINFVYKKCGKLRSSYVNGKIFFCDRCSECPDGSKSVKVLNIECNNSVKWSI